MTLNADFVRTARAKGLSEPVILLRHCLRNAMLPVVTVIALSFGALMSGTLVVETMYGILGMGKAIYDAIVNKDFNVALAGLLLARQLPGGPAHDERMRQPRRAVHASVDLVRERLPVRPRGLRAHCGRGLRSGGLGLAT